MSAEANRPEMPEATAQPAGGQARAALVSIGAATLLVVLKLGTGIVTGSLGLVSAGIGHRAMSWRPC